MLFKVHSTISGLAIHSRDVLSFTLDTPEPISLSVRAPNEEERAKGQKSYNAVYDVIGEFHPTKKAQPVFTAIFEERRPLEGQKARSAEEMVIRDGPSYGLEYYPDPFIAFVDKVRSRLGPVTRKLIDVLRWRYAQEGPPSPIGSGALLCSNDDGNSWRALPGRYSIRSITPSHSVFVIKEADVDEIIGLVGAGHEEPAYHELLREAKELQYGSPRSSILIAMSAAEIAVKSTITKNFPAADWLIDNIQSPPLVKILMEYLPRLFFQESALYEAKKESRLMKTIEDGVFIRNRIIHRGSPPPPSEKIRELIDVVQELLWICDYYCGYRWAGKHIEIMRRRNTEGL